IAPAPFLETLHLETRIYDDESLNSDSVIFRDEPPSSLHTLYLKNFSLPPTSILFTPSLTSMSLVDCSEVWETFAEMRQTLARMPLLQNVCLRDSLPDISTTPSPTLLSLPHLHTLLLGGRAPQVAESLRFISTSTVTSLDLELDSIGSDAMSRSDTLHNVLSQWIKTSPSTYHSLSFLRGTLPLQTEIIFDPSTSHSDGSAGRKLTVRVVLPAAVASTFFWDLLPPKLGIFSQLRVLVVSALRFNSLWLWQELSAVANEIQEITVFGFNACHGLLNAFQSGASSPNPLTLFPKLAHLRLQNFPFKHTRSRDSPSQFRSLVLDLQRRRGRGSTCQLSISNCVLTAKEIKELRNTVGADRFHWDGKVSLVA
ncbi:hypothetical protein BV25DRAFT_1832406, partial [Artomyces pyxidatus]